MSRVKTRSASSSEIGALRTRLGKKLLGEGKELSRAQFAEKLGVSPVAVLHWEKGARQPSPEIYIRLATLVQEVDPDDPELALKFWEKAGVKAAALASLLPQVVSKRLRQPDFATGVKIPVVKKTTELLKPKLATSDIQEWIVADAAHVPSTARALYVGKQWMSHPREGDVLVLDVERIIDADTAFKLDSYRGQLLAAYAGQSRPPHDAIASSPRLQGVIPGSAADVQLLPGITVGWLEIWKIVDVTERFEARLLTGLHTHLVAFKGSPAPNFQLYSGVEFLIPVLQWVRARI